MQIEPHVNNQIKISEVKVGNGKKENSKIQTGKTDKYKDTTNIQVPSIFIFLFSNNIIYYLLTT